MQKFKLETLQDILNFVKISPVVNTFKEEDQTPGAIRARIASDNLIDKDVELLKGCFRKLFTKGLEILDKSDI